MEKDYVTAYHRHLYEYQTVMEEIIRERGSKEAVFITSGKVAEQTGLNQQRVYSVINSMAKPGGLLQQVYPQKRTPFYKVLYENVAEEGPFAEIPLVMFFQGILNMSEINSKAKTLGVSTWTYSRALAYLQEDYQFYRKNPDYDKAFSELLTRTVEKYHKRIEKVIEENKDHLSEAFFIAGLRVLKENGWDLGNDE